MGFNQSRLSVTTDDEPTKSEFNNMVKAKIRRYWKNRERILLKNQNEGTTKQMFHLKISWIQKKKKKNSTIETKYYKNGNKVLMFETVKSWPGDNYKGKSYVIVKR